MGESLNAKQIPGTGAGGEPSEGYLRGKRLSDYFEGTEQPAFVLTNEKKGIKHEQDEETRVVKPGDDCCAVTAITDERVLLVVGGNDDGTGPNRDVSLPYTEIRSVETNTGMFKSRLSITARTSDTYHFVLGGRKDLDEVERFVERAVAHWVAVDRRLEKAKDHLSTIESHLESGDPEAASHAYRRTRELLDQARDVASDFKPGTHAMGRRIDQLDTRLTLTQIRGHRTRARQLTETANAARKEGDYETALSSYTTAQDQYEQAVALADDIEYHEVSEMQTELADVSTTVSGMQSEPLVRASMACQQASNADGPAIDAWRSALETCHDTYRLLSRTGDQFDGNPDALRFQIEWVVQNLLRAHERAAERAEERAKEYAAEGETEAAHDAYETAHQHLVDARSLAAEFRSGSPETYEEAIEYLAGQAPAVGTGAT